MDFRERIKKDMAPGARPRRRYQLGPPVDYMVIAKCIHCGWSSKREWWERKVRCPDCKRMCNIKKHPRDHIWV